MVFIPSFHNYQIWSFLGLGMTTYTTWYLAIAAIINGQVIIESVFVMMQHTQEHNTGGLQLDKEETSTTHKAQRKTSRKIS